MDTAAVYRNHSTIAATLTEVLPRLGLSRYVLVSLSARLAIRQDVFLTSKLGPKDQGAEKCQAAIDLALEELQTDYLDLYLIHWPGVQVSANVYFELKPIVSGCRGWQHYQQRAEAGELGRAGGEPQVAGILGV